MGRDAAKKWTSLAGFWHNSDRSDQRNLHGRSLRNAMCMKSLSTRTTCSLALLAILLCGYGPCSTSHCPSGATTGPDYGCWYEISKPHDALSINQGELQIQVHNHSQRTHEAHPLYRFAFIRDPQEQLPTQEHGRIGQWKLEIFPREEQRATRTFALSWKLRDSLPALQQKESIRLAVSWMGQKQRHYQILPGRYDVKQHRLYAVLSSQLLQQPHAYLVPVRYKAAYLASKFQPSYPSRFASFVHVAATSR